VRPRWYALESVLRGDGRSGLGSCAISRKEARQRIEQARRTRAKLSLSAHTATSLMKEAGIPEATVRDIIGHESKAVSANYTHVDEAAKRSALEKYSKLLLPTTRKQ
jgi:integrase